MGRTLDNTGRSGVDKLRIDWKKVWSENSKWFDRMGDASWEAQQRNIQKLVEKQLNAKKESV